MRIIQINWCGSNNRHSINIDKIMSIDFEAIEKRICIYMQDARPTIFNIVNRDENELKRIYENILDFCMSTSDPNEIGYMPLLKIDIDGKINSR